MTEPNDKNLQPPVPEGYYEVFSEDFSGKKVEREVRDNQWWYVLRGEGPDWDAMSAADRDQNRPLRIQTLVGQPKQQPEQYVNVEVVQDEARGNVLKTTVLKDDPDFPAISRSQLLFKLDKHFNKLFHTYAFKIPSEMKSHIKPEENIAWLLITEFHHFGPNHNRLGLYILNDPDKGYHYALQLRDQAKMHTLWLESVKAYDAWDQWQHIALQVETEGAGPQDGLLRLWIDGELVFDKSNIYLGYPINNMHTLKAYVAKPSMPYTVYWDHAKLYRKD